MIDIYLIKIQDIWSHYPFTNINLCPKDTC